MATIRKRKLEGKVKNDKMNMSENRMKLRNMTLTKNLRTLKVITTICHMSPLLNKAVTYYKK